MLTARAQWVIAVSAIVTVFGGARLHSATRAKPVRVTIGDRAPAFTRLRSLDRLGAAGAVSLDGGPQLLVVWATWCAACRKELPSLESLYRDLRPVGLRINSVNVDDASAAKAVKSLVDSTGITFDVVLDPDGRVGRAYGVGPIPQTFLIDREGVIRDRLVGEHDWSSPRLRERVRDLLAR